MSHTMQTMKGAAQEAALLDCQSVFEQIDALVRQAETVEASEDTDHSRETEQLARKAGAVPVSVYGNVRRNADQFSDFADLRTLARKGWRLAHDACGGSHD